jgi:nicotinamide riboside kinase
VAEAQQMSAIIQSQVRREYSRAFINEETSTHQMDQNQMKEQIKMMQGIIETETASIHKNLKAISKE